jgi:hypothetical protein
MAMPTRQIPQFIPHTATITVPHWSLRHWFEVVVISEEVHGFVKEKYVTQLVNF